MYAAPGGPDMQWGAHISNGGPGATGSLAGGGPDRNEPKIPVPLSFCFGDARTSINKL